MKLRPKRPSAASLIALLALFVALGGPAEAAKLINGKQIKRGTITTTQIKDRTIRTRDISRSTVRALRATPIGSIGTNQLAFASVTAAKLAPNSVAGDKLADSSVNSAKIADNTIARSDIAPLAVGNAALGNSAVSKSKIGPGAVGTSELQQSSVANEDLAPNSVTADKVVDGSLTTPDLGIVKFQGTFAFDFGSIPAGECATSTDQTVTAAHAPADAATAAWVVTPNPWDDKVALTAFATGATTIRVTACNGGSTAVVPASATFRYVAFG